MQHASGVQRPAPPISSYNRAFWEYAAKGELRLPQCTACGKPWAPPGPVCPACFSRKFEWVKMSGKGRIGSFTIFHKNYHPFFKDRLPYNVALVDLAEGPRLLANVLDIPNDRLEIGMELEVVFENVGDRFTIPQFRPADPKARG